MDKLIRDNHVAVIYSPGFGGGWSTWNFSHPDCVFDKEIAEQVLDREDPKRLNDWHRPSGHRATTTSSQVLPKNCA